MLRVHKMRLATAKTMWACVAAAAGAGLSTTACAENPAIEDVPIVPNYDAAKEVKVELKPDLTATGFSAQNAYFFSMMSKIVYSPKLEVEGAIKGNATNKGLELGFDHFFWFEADPAVSKESALDAVHDTEAFIAANDEMIMVVFRGTSEAQDWATNLSIGQRVVPADWGLGSSGGHVHQGFDDGVNTIWNEKTGMHETIKALYNEEGKNRKLYLAGHSLGGALATIAAGRLVFVDDFNIAGMYTIGSPRVIDGVLAKTYDAKMNDGTALKDKYFRCRNNNDIVPRMVPSPYEHVGREIYLDRFGIVSVTSFVDRLLGRLSSYLRLSFIEGVNDHSSSEYVRLFKQVVVNERVSLLDKATSVVKDAAQKVIKPIVQTESSKKQEAEIEEAKTAALEASKVAADPSNATVDTKSPEL